jgi:hypothetical protein
MLFKLEENGFIICVCLILLTSCIIMYYFHTRASMIETSISRQNKVLADFFSTFQSDLRRNTIGGDGDIHLEESCGKELNDADVSSYEHSIDENQNSPGSLSKIEVSDDDECESGIKLVKVSRSDADSDSESESDSDSESETNLDLDSDSDLVSDKGTDCEEEEAEEGSGGGGRFIINSANEIYVNVIEDLNKVNEDPISNYANTLDIKEIFINTCNSRENENASNKCIVEEVIVINESNPLSSPSPVPEQPITIITGTEPLKKLKITKLSSTTSSSSTEKEKEKEKKESVAELRAKAVLLGLVGKEDSSKLKKNEILELLRKSNNNQMTLEEIRLMKEADGVIV